MYIKYAEYAKPFSFTYTFTHAIRIDKLLMVKVPLLALISTAVSWFSRYVACFTDHLDSGYHN